MALEDHGAVEARSFDRLIVHDHGAFAWYIKPGQDVKYRGLAAAGVADHAGEFTALHRQPEIFEHRDLPAAGAGIALCDRLDGNESFGHRVIPGT